MTGEPTIGIIAALEHEFAAMKSMIEEPVEQEMPGQGAGRRYIRGYIQNFDGYRHLVVLGLADKGNNVAAARASQMLTHFPSVKAIIMVGIAGAVPHPTVPERHVRLGDIVVSDKKGIVQFDLRKETAEGEEICAAPISPSAELVEAVRLLRVGQLEGKRPWDSHIEKAIKRLGWKRPATKADVLESPIGSSAKLTHPKDPERQSGRPRVFVGPIAASNTVVKNASRRDMLRDKFGVMAIEMEGSGIADATWIHSRGYLVIRGTCDYCDAAKNNVWQNYAAIIAAGYARALIESLPSITSTPGPAAKSHVLQLTAAGWPPPIEYVLDLANRSAELEFFQSLLSDTTSRRAMFLQGPQNHGKTALVRECRRYAQELLGSGACALIDFKADASKQFALDTLRLRLGHILPNFGHTNSSVGDLRGDLNSLTSPAVLLFDAYEKASGDARELVSMLLHDLDQLNNVRIVIAGQDVPDHAKAVWAWLVQYFFVGAIPDHAEWHSYTERCLGAAKLENVRLLTTVTQGVAGSIRPLLENLVKSKDN